MSAWELVPYMTQAGRSPVIDYLEALPAHDAARAEIELNLLTEFGTDLGMPHARPITEGLWELRIRGRVQHRVIYVAIHGLRMLLLHAFTKKTEKTPAREVRIALDRLTDYRRRLAP